MQARSRTVLERLDALVTWYMPHQCDAGAHALSAQRMFVSICLVNFWFCVLYALTSLAIGFVVGAILMTIGIVCLFACLFFFRATGRWRASVNLYMANCAFVAILGCSFFSGGLNSPVTPWFTLVPVAAVLLLGYCLDVVVWVAVCLAIPLAYGMASQRGYVFVPLYRQELATVFDMICTAGLVTVLFLFALIFDRNSRVALEQVLDSRKEVERLARSQALQAERGRILRNMHDGVGSHISSAMRQLRGDADTAATPLRGDVLKTLRDALDQLKLSIDSIHLAPGDVTALLANMRYRLGPRFAGEGIELQWDVELLPVSQSLDASAMSELQFMLFEALSNVLQHAHAKVLRVEGHLCQVGAAEQIFVRVVDDGCGFDVDRGQRNGMATMRERAAAIGAQLRISSTPGKTVVEIQLAT